MKEFKKYFYVERVTNNGWYPSTKKGYIDPEPEATSIGLGNNEYMGWVDSEEDFNWIFKQDNVRKPTKKEIQFYNLMRKLNEI